jgi:hypothetical protein
VWVSVCIGYVTFHRCMCLCSICRVSWVSVVWMLGMSCLMGECLYFGEVVFDKLLCYVGERVLDMPHSMGECVGWMRVCVGYAVFNE